MDDHGHHLGALDVNPRYSTFLWRFGAPEEYPEHPEADGIYRGVMYDTSSIRTGERGDIALYNAEQEK